MAWPDHGVPEKKDFPLLKYLIQIIKDERSKEDCPPIVVHCSAGVGRTGTLIAMILLDELLERYRVFLKSTTTVSPVKIRYREQCRGWN